MESNNSTHQKATVLRKLKSYSSIGENEHILGYGNEKTRSNVLKRHKGENGETLNFLHGDEARQQNSCDVMELTALRTRGASANAHSIVASHNKPASDIVILERDILPSDTLQSFALLYGCTLNDLKRANNLIKEQEFFALRRIKIPVKKYGLLTDIEEELKRRPGTTISGDISNLSCVTLEETNMEDNLSLEPSVLSDVYEYESQDSQTDSSNDQNSPLLSSQVANVSKTTAIEHNDATKFLKKVDKEIRDTVLKSANVAEKNEALEEVVSSLGSVGFQPLPLPGTKLHDCDGATWGLKWSTVMLSFVFGLALVIVFILIRSLVGL